VATVWPTQIALRPVGKVRGYEKHIGRVSKHELLRRVQLATVRTRMRHHHSIHVKIVVGLQRNASSTNHENDEEREPCQLAQPDGDGEWPPAVRLRRRFNIGSIGLQEGAR